MGRMTGFEVFPAIPRYVGSGMAAFGQSASASGRLFIGLAVAATRPKVGHSASPRRGPKADVGIA